LRRDHGDPGPAQAQVANRLHHRRCLRAARHPDQRDVRLRILDALDEGREIGLAVGKRTDPAIAPPASTKALVKASSPSWPGMKSLTAV